MSGEPVAKATVALVVVAAVATNVLVDDAVVSLSCYLGVIVGAAVLGAVGAARAPRGRRLVPGLVAAGIALTALGNALWTVLDSVGATTDVSIADLAWLSSYVLLCGALWTVLLRSGDRVDVDFLLDALTIVVVSVMVFWTMSIDAIVADQSASPLVRAVWVAYPIADAVLLALVIRVLMSRTARAAVGAPFAVGVCLWLAADVAYLLWTGGGVPEVIMTVGWMVAPVLMASTAWRNQPVQVELSGSHTLGWRAQVLVAVGPLMVPPGLELAADLVGEHTMHLQLLVGTAILITLAFVRTGRLIRAKERINGELEISRAAAMAASHAKSMFLANMSHEIRTPLTSVLAAVEMLEDTPLDDTQRMLLARTQRSGELLKILVEQTLDFSRIEAGEVRLALKPFDLHTLVSDTVEAVEPRATRAGIGFEHQLDPRTPRVVVGDPARLLQVLTNLLENAVKFTHKGRVSLVVGPVESNGSDADGSDDIAVVEFVVADTGIGIPEVDQESVFESFKQVDGTTTRQYEGSGLGLAICRELTELMGGTVALRSQVGVGSTFTVRVPLALASPAASPDASSVASSDGVTPSASGDREPATAHASSMRHVPTRSSTPVA